jgi:hypothetical protein
MAARCAEAMLPTTTGEDRMDKLIAASAVPTNATGPDPPAKKRRGCFFYGCLTTIVVVLLAAGAAYYVYQYGKSTITPVVEEFLKAAEGGDYDHAYAMVASEWKQKIPRDEFPDLFKRIHDVLGSRRSDQH